MKWAILTVTIAAAAAAQRPAFRTGVDAVRVDVQVTKDGRPVPNLRAADFQLLDSGVPQRIDVVSLEQQPADVLLAFDTSDSMTGEPLATLKEAAHAAIGVLAPDDHAALLTFSQKLSIDATWTTDRRVITGAIDATQASGKTALQDAVFAACTLREGVRDRMLVLLFSDGVDTVSWLPSMRVLDQARRTDAVFDAVSLPPVDPTPREVRGSAPPPRLAPAKLDGWFLREPVLFRERFLSVLAQDTGGDAIVATTPALRDVFVRIIRLFKMRYVLSYTPQNVPPGGWHPLSVRLTHLTADVRARSGYQR